MAWSRPPQSLLDTLSYFDEYDYPLTYSEIRTWSSVPLPLNPPPSLGEGCKGEVQKKAGYYFLPGRQKIVRLRKQREQFSQRKWAIAKKAGESLRKFPSITAVFVTGALAMDNCPADDDIDLMLVTRPHTLWLIRPWVLGQLVNRRRPGERVADDKICPNLWLDERHLGIATSADGERNLYLAHEILQAKCIMDRGSVHRNFLHANSWTRNYLPTAYRESSKKLNSKNSDLIKNWKLKIANLVLWPLNVLFFAAQYLYMLPKKTTERVSLGYAFLHPARPA